MKKEKRFKSRFSDKLDESKKNLDENIKIIKEESEKEKQKTIENNDSESSEFSGSSSRPRKHRRIGWIVMIITAVVVGTIGVYLLVQPNLGISTSSAKNMIVGSDTVELEELQDENGRYIVLDYPADVDLLEYITLPDLSEITVEPVDEGDDSDEAVLDVYKSYIAEYDKYTKRTEGTAHIGDLIDVTFTAWLNGVQVDDFTMENNIYTLGSGGEPEDFAKNLNGAEIGQTLEFDVFIPEDYDSELYAGKTLNFEAVINSVNEIPELTDENVNELTDGAFDSREAFLDELKTELQAYNRSNYEDKLAEEIIEKLEEESKFGTMPHELLVWYVSLTTGQLQIDADVYDMTVQEYLDDAGLGNLDDIIESAIENAGEGMKDMTILGAVAQQEDIAVDEESDKNEIQQFEEEIISELGLKDTEVLENYYKKSNMYRGVLDWKVMEWLIDNINQVESEDSEEE